MISTTTRQAYSEVDEFIELLNDKDKQKIPEDLRKIFKTEKDKEYKKGIDLNIPIKDQNLKRETLAIIAMLNLKYWCEDEKEREKLKKIYEKNEIEYQEGQRRKYNPDEIFKKKQLIKNYEDVKQEENAIIKISKMRQIINKIIKFFNRT